MQVIRHAIDRDQFLALIRNDAGDVFVEILSEFGPNEGKSTFNCEDSLNVDLGVRICRSGLTWIGIRKREVFAPLGAKCLSSRGENKSTKLR